jgi:hypothetical protein
MNQSLARRIELARSVNVPWDSARAERVAGRVAGRRRRRVRYLELCAVAFASTALLAGLIRISAALRQSTDFVASPASTQTPAQAAALGDGGYEASLR